MKFSYRIEGMHCAACIEKIKLALSSLKVLEVSLTPPRLLIEADALPSLETLNRLIAQAGAYRLQEEMQPHVDNSHPVESHVNAKWAYYPLFLIISYITGVTVINNVDQGAFRWEAWMNQFMAGFFLVFSAFKMLDLRGFAAGYATYDLLARRWYGYGYIYPFLELGLGILYLGAWALSITQVLTIIVMGFSSLGVINSLFKKQTIKCACLGTLLNVPLSSITIIEDLGMVAMAIFGLLMA